MKIKLNLNLDILFRDSKQIQQSIIYRTNFELSSPSWIDIDTGRTRLGFGTSGPVLGTTVNHEMIQIKGSTVN